ncbi:hypothetical protein ACFFQW_28990 [Umezawaea endophytica]|uniref:Uncharacterized protein n=1 Tax=Umezawaea endophytica TaxID=1654476 RepID=A0A9X2VWF3_9PSEU|nr:hypothetical protein [Umezawaea endophytica]MCS7484131.1 hypothetical protein [Umezawaea endophytica]
MVAPRQPRRRVLIDSVEVKHPPGEPDRIRPDKPERGKTGNSAPPGSRDAEALALLDVVRAQTVDATT